MTGDGTTGDGDERPLPPEAPFEDALESLLSAAWADGVDVTGAWDVETRDGEYTVEIWPIDREEPGAD